MYFCENVKFLRYALGSNVVIKISISFYILEAFYIHNIFLIIINFDDIMNFNQLIDSKWTIHATFSLLRDSFSKCLFFRNTRYS